MARKKKPASKTKGKAAAKRKSSDGFVAFLRSKQFAHIRGAFYILFSIFLLIAMAGYYASRLKPPKVTVCTAVERSSSRR